MKRDEGGIFSRAPDWKTLLFLLKIKILKKSGCPRKGIQCNLQAHSSKYQDLSEQNEALTNKLRLSQRQFGCLAGDTAPGKFCCFFLHLNWHKIVIKVWTFLFLENWQFNHALSPTSTLCPKDSLVNWKKIRSTINWEKICFPLGKNKFNSIGNSAHTTEFLTFRCLLKQTTCRMKALQVQVYIQQWFHDEQGGKFM